MGAISGMGCAFIFRNSKSSVYTPLEEVIDENEEESELESSKYKYVIKKRPEEKSSSYDYFVDKDDLVWG